MDAAGMAPPAGMATLAPTANSANAESTPGSSDKGFWQALTSATDPQPDDVAAPSATKDEKTTDAAAAVAAVAAWIPPILVSGFPMPSLPAETTTDVSVTRIFGSPSGIIPGSPIGLPTQVGTVAANPLSVTDNPAQADAAAIAGGNQAQIDAFVATSFPLATDLTAPPVGGATEIAPPLTATLPAATAAASGGATEIAPPLTATLPAATAAASGRATEIAQSAPPTDSASVVINASSATIPSTSMPPGATLADQTALPEGSLTDGIAPDPPILNAPPSSAAPQAPNTAAIAAGIAVATGQTTVAQSAEAQAAAAQLADADDSQAPGSGATRTRGAANAAGGEAANLALAATPGGSGGADPLTTPGGSGDADPLTTPGGSGGADPLTTPGGSGGADSLTTIVPPTPTTGGQSDAGPRPRFEFRVTDDGVEPISRNLPSDAQANEGFANLLGAAGAVGPNTGAAPLLAADAVAQGITDVQVRTLVGQVVQQAALLRFPDRTEMTIELTPPHLGAVYLHLTQSESGGLSLQMRADDPNVQQMFAGNIEQLTARLHEQGHTVSVDLRWDREAGREAPNRGRQGDEAPPDQRQPADLANPPADSSQSRPALDRRVDYRA